MSDTPDRPSDLSRIFGEFLARRRLGESPTLDEYCQRFPDLAEQLRMHVHLYDALGEAGSEKDVRGSIKDLHDPVAPALDVPNAAIECVPSEEQPQRIGNSQVLALLEDMLNSGKTPEVACLDCPELLPEVRRRWQEFCLINAQAEALLPGLRADQGADAIGPGLPSHGLPQVPGYAVEAVLGYGGMGVVYKARQLALDRPVAVKMLLAGPYAGPQELARFHRETAALASLRHPNIVQVYDAGDVEGRPYLTIELVEGGSLARKLSGAPQPARPAAALVSVLASAVEVAHRGGIVHRDLKPGNILLLADGTPKVSDFGLARRLRGETGLTPAGAALGTPSYMAPEQALGRVDAVGPLIDVYALGAILYEVLTGRPPFRAETDLETLQQAASLEPVPPSRLNATIPRDLETICLKCLHKEPLRRYATAAALAEDLNRFQRGEAIAARPEGPAARLARRVRQRPALSVAVATSALLLCVVVGGGLWVLFDRAADRRAKDAAEVVTEQAAKGDVEEMVRWLRQSSWREAGVALKLAEGRLGDRGSAELHRRLDQGRRDLELALRFEALSSRAGGSVGSQTYAAECETLFRDAGLGLVTESPEVVAERVGASDIRDALVRALDEWVFYTADRERRKWSGEVARLADPDPSGWRTLVNDPNILKDEAALDRLLRTAPRPFPSLPLLQAIHLRLLEQGKDPVPLLKRVQEAHPEAFSVNYRLGWQLGSRNPAEAVRYLQAAVSLSPNHVAANRFLGNALSKLGRLDEALAQYRRVEELAPTDYSDYLTIADVLSELGRYDEAEAQLRRGVALRPQLPLAQMPLWSFLVRHGRADQALREWAAAVPAAPTDYRLWNGYPELCLLAGRPQDYRAARRSILTRFGTTDDPVQAAWASRSCLLLPAEGDELRQAVALAKRITAVDPRPVIGVNEVLVDRLLAKRITAVDPRQYPPQSFFFQFAKVLADYRQGEFDRAITQLRGEQFPRPAYRLVLAMALHRTGKGADARATLAEAVLSPDWRVSHARDQDDWLDHVLRREAESLILPNLPAFLEGTYQPRDNDERLALLGVCQFTNRTHALASLYADAFAADPRLAKDPGTGHRFRAACAAAQAGCGRGADATGLGESDRRRWREQARQWLREDLAVWEQSLGGPAASRLRAAVTLTRWRGNTDLAGLRAPSEVAKLPSDERRDCLALWVEIDDLLHSAGGTTPKP
jgi:serine/threonine-protein kinase